MKKVMKVYVSKRVGWFVVALLAAIWGFVLYLTFWSHDRASQMSRPGFAFTTLVLLIVAVFVSLSASGRMPTHVIEIDDDDDPKPPR